MDEAQTHQPSHGDGEGEVVDEFLTHEQQKILAAQGRDWQILGSGHADQVLARIGTHQAKQAMLRQDLGADIAAKREWLARAAQQAEGAIGFLKGKLDAFYRRMESQGFVTAKRKAFSLPHGYLSTRYQAPDYETTDAAALLAWAKAQPVDGLWETIEQPVLRAIQERLVPVAECTFMRPVIDAVTGEILREEIDHPAAERAAQFGSFAVVDRETFQVVPGVIATRLSAEVFVAVAVAKKVTKEPSA